MSRRRPAPAAVEAVVTTVGPNDSDELPPDEFYCFTAKHVLLRKNGKVTELKGVDAERARRWILRPHLKRP